MDNSSPTGNSGAMNPTGLPADPATLAELARTMGKLHIYTYDGPCFAIFAFAGLLLQFPLIYVYLSIPHPNIPVVIMSGWYIYITLSQFITAVSWTGDNPAKWWKGYGWCDIDIRLEAAASLGILAAQCVINWNLLRALCERPLTEKQSRWEKVAELTFMLALPVISLVVMTFTTENRYSIVQYVGCTANRDTSLAHLLSHLIWIPFFGIIALILMLVAVWKFYHRGQVASMELVTFLSQMAPEQFFRVVIFSVIVTFVLVPLTVSIGVTDFIQLGRVGIKPMAWLNGKPKKWNIITTRTWLELQLASIDHWIAPPLEIAFIAKYVNLAIALILFLCYGTGVVARSRYKETWVAIRRFFKPQYYRSNEGWIENSELLDSLRVISPTIEGDSTSHPRTTEKGDWKSHHYRTTVFSEWDHDFDGELALEQWKIHRDQRANDYENGRAQNVNAVKPQRQRLDCQADHTHYYTDPPHPVGNILAGQLFQTKN